MLENDSLWMQIHHGEKSKLMPESETTFFFEGREEENLTFNRNDIGNLISITVFGTESARKL